MALLAGLLLSHTVGFSAGCAPKDGTEGGKCLSSNGCNGGYCDGADLTCNGDNICVKESPPTPVPPPAPGPCDSLFGVAPCPAGWVQSCVDGSAAVDPAWNGACVAQPIKGNSATVFCCDDSKPTCQFRYGGLTPGVSVNNWQSCPGEAFACHDLSAPPLPEASIQCANDGADDAGWAFTCCVEGDSCFVFTNSAPASSVDGYYPQGSCAPGEAEHFCTGKMALGGPCRALDSTDAAASPTQARAFCCPQGYAPPAYEADAGDDGPG